LPQLQDLQDAHLSFGRVLGAQRQDRVGDRELRRIAGIGVVIFADPERRDSHGREPAGEVVQETTEGTGIGRVDPQRLEAVDHHQPRPPLPQQFGDPGQDTRQPLVVEHLAEVVVEDAGAEGGGVEVIQGLAVTEDLLQGLGDRGEIERRTARSGVAEQILLGQDGLSRAWPAGEQGDSVERQTAAEHLVQAIRAAGQSIDHRPWARRPR
jgi:hypothetical protein